MNLNHKAALMEYIEFHLDQFAERIQPHVEPEYVPTLWKMSRDMLTDMDRTFDMEVALTEAHTKVQSKKQ